MSETAPLTDPILFHAGPVPVARQVVTTWGIMAVLVVGAWLSTRGLARRPESRVGAALEAAVGLLGEQIRSVIRRDPRPLLPFLGTLFVFLLVANLSSLVPGVRAPTASPETPAALALLVFFAVHALGVHERGAWRYLKSYAEPNVLMLPLNVLSEITRTFSLMIRLFGNMMSHELVLGIVLALAGLLVPIPFMALGVLIGVIQAYIFTILATVFIGAATETHQTTETKE